MKIHIVQKGDTLWKIAKKYGVNFEELKQLNAQLSNPDMIMPGMKIKVPTGGGTIKKEAPIVGGTPQAKINMGGKKEMPIAKEKPMPIPQGKKEAPVKEQPKKEMPKPVPKEEPVKPYKPKMPVQIKPEIDINNYYMMNMANMQFPPQPKSQPKSQHKPQPKAQPQLPPKPENIFPEVKPEAKQIKPQVKPELKPLPQKVEGKQKIKSEIKPDIKIEKNEFMDESPSMMPFVQGGYQQPMIPYPYNYYPGAPSMSGPAYGYPEAHQMPNPQVQGVSQYPGMMPNMALPVEDMESSSFAMMQNSVMGENMPQYAAPQMTGPTFYGVPISPVMPGPGYIPQPSQIPMPEAGGMMPGQMPMMPQNAGMMENQMPQVAGMMEEESSEMPMMPQMPQVGGMMENQMPYSGGMMPGNMPQMPQV
ncbi:SafA/ExsA family spore coat assembly protein, partial [Mesobacillus subterraneus]|uniref:SafA/ExsA family spore coat assembly protein n=1 Tax=Mesobacillus subterraneus TaxID=285983 RepID=UPI00069B26B6